MNSCTKCGTVNQIDIKYVAEQVWQTQGNGISSAVFKPNKNGGVEPVMQEYLQKKCRVCGYLWQEDCINNQIKDSKGKKLEHILD